MTKRSAFLRDHLMAVHPNTIQPETRSVLLRHFVVTERRRPQRSRTTTLSTTWTVDRHGNPLGHVTGGASHPRGWGRFCFRARGGVVQGAVIRSVLVTEAAR